MGARTTETNRQGRAGQTSCTNVHKANLGSQLSIFDTGSFARNDRPHTAPSNDPPERVHTGALKRPAPTETNRQGRAGQTSCTNVHKANLGSQLSIFDTGSFARVRPNDPPERPARTSSHGRPQPARRFFMGARTTETNRQGRAGQTSCTNVHKANLGSQLSIFDIRPSPERPARTSSHGRPQTTRPNEFTRALSSNDPPKMTHPNEFTRAPSNDPPERFFTLGALKRPRLNDFAWAPERPKRTDKGESGKRAARTCTKPTSGHNLAFLIRATALTRTTRPNEFTRAPSNDPPERPARTSSHGHPQTTRPNDPNRNEARREFTRGKRAARTCQSQPRVTTSHGRPAQTTRPDRHPRTTRLERVHTGALKRPAPSSHGCPQTTAPQTTRPNDFAWAPERPKRTDKGEPGKRAARTCTKPTSGHNLAFLIRPSPERPARTSSHGRPQTTRLNEPPERPARTSSHGRPQTTRPNYFSWAPERPKRTDKGEPGKRAARMCTKPTSGHNLAFLIRPSPGNDRTPERVHHGRPQTTRPNEFTRAPYEMTREPSNDPPERPTQTSSHGRPQTTRPNDPPERPARTTHPNDTTPNDPPERPDPNDPPERVHTGVHKRPARMTLPERVHTGALKQPARTILHGCPNDRNEPTRESRANELHERAQSQPRVTT
jgi:hypothetical protein